MVGAVEGAVWVYPPSAPAPPVMVHAFATLIARPETVDATREALAGLVGPSRNEDGCQHYELFQSTDEPTRFQTVERWSSSEAVRAHLGSEHVQAALAAAGDLLGAEPVIQSFEQVA